MGNILKAEFKKLFKGKLIYILMAAGVGFSLLTGILYNQMSGFYDEFGPMEFSVLEIFSQSFSPLNNFGVMLLIFVLIIGTSDFTQKTIRTKLVGGYSRTEIYLSSLIKIFVIAIISMAVHLLSTYLFLIMFVDTKSESFSDYLQIIVIGTSAILVLYSVVNVFSFIFGKFGATFGLTMAVITVPTILQMIFLFTIESSTINDIISYLFPLSSLMGIQVLDTGEFLLTMFANISLIVLINFLGIMRNRKIDYV